MAAAACSTFVFRVCIADGGMVRDKEDRTLTPGPPESIWPYGMQKGLPPGSAQAQFLGSPTIDDAGLAPRGILDLYVQPQ